MFFEFKRIFLVNFLIQSINFIVNILMGKGKHKIYFFREEKLFVTFILMNHLSVVQENS